MTTEVCVAIGSRKVTVSVAPVTVQSATAAPATWLTASPAGSAITRSRASPCETTSCTLEVTCVESSPSETSCVTCARVRSGWVDRRSSALRFHVNESGRPGLP